MAFISINCWTNLLRKVWNGQIYHNVPVLNSFLQCNYTMLLLFSDEDIQMVDPNQAEASQVKMHTALVIVLMSHICKSSQSSCSCYLVPFLFIKEEIYTFISGFTFMRSIHAFVLVWVLAQW